MRRYVVFGSVLVSLVHSGTAQTFSSGSSGADGPLQCTSGVKRVMVPPSGVFHHTTITIDNGCGVEFEPNAVSNPPVTLLASGDVIIRGWLSVSAREGGPPGPGGFPGGAPGQPGAGPGGGAPGQPGRWVGPLSLVPNIGGSGGGGLSLSRGGHGGGAITIASSTKIVMSYGWPGDAGIFARAEPVGDQIRGAKGAIRLVANRIEIENPVYFDASVVRIEAPAEGILIRGSWPGGLAVPVLAPINPVVDPAQAPSLKITSVAGYPVNYSGGSGVDLILPRDLTDPIPVTVEAKRVPPGSVVRVSITGSTGATSTSAPVTGTFALSSATVQVSGLDRSAISYLYVSTSFDPAQQAGSLGLAWPPEAASIEVIGDLSGSSTYRMLGKDGRELGPVPASRGTATSH
jgi:hypothetical protein